MLHGARGGDRLQRLVAAARSGLRRYPSQIAQSLRDARARAHDRHADPGATPWPIEGVRSAGGLAASWLGHATALVKVGPLTVLTDPVLARRIGPTVGGVTVGLSRREGAPPPPAADTFAGHVDVVLLSHAHYDHLDKPSLRRLAHPRTTVVTARRTADLIPPGFGRVVELDWSSSFEIGGVRFGAFRPAHWGARTAWDRRRGYNAYTMEAREGRVVYAGDTALTDAFDRMGVADLAIFGIGAYEPLVNAHATPEQVWQMFRGIPGERLLPVHHSTFELSDERHDEPMERLLRAAGEEARRVVGRTAGEVWRADAE